MIYLKSKDENDIYLKGKGRTIVGVPTIKVKVNGISFSFQLSAFKTLSQSYSILRGYKSIKEMESSTVGLTPTELKIIRSEVINHIKTNGSKKQKKALAS